MERATKAVKLAGLDRARIVMDLNKAVIEIIIGEAANESHGTRNPFDED